MAPSPLVCIMNVRLRGVLGLERACCDAAKAMGVTLKAGMQPTSPVRRPQDTASMTPRAR